MDTILKCKIKYSNSSLELPVKNKKPTINVFTRFVTKNSFVKLSYNLEIYMKTNTDVIDKKPPTIFIKTALIFVQILKI